MIKYDSDWLKEICQKVNLLEYASKTHEFKKCGYDTYCAKCNIHNDINPSLIITPSKNLWYCHGCRRGGDIISWIMAYEGLSFRGAVEKIASMVGEDINESHAPSSSLSVLKRMGSATSQERKSKISDRKELSADYWNKFEIVPHEPHEWIDEGISEEILRKFDVRIDRECNRIVYPVYDNNDRMIGVKGRTRYRNYGVLGIKKYTNYIKIGTVDYLQGMHENRNEIFDADEIIIFEGIKSVMKCATWRQNNSVAAETSRLNDYQIELLLKLGVTNVVLAFDSDVPMKQIIESANKLKSFLNVYIISDTDHLLGDPSEKRAPVDCGKEVWEKLYAGRKRII